MTRALTLRMTGTLILTSLALGAAALGAASCGGGASSGAADAGKDANATDAKGVKHDADANVCHPSSGGLEPPAPSQFALDGGVAPEFVSYATAIARCNYFNRCTPLSADLIKQCIASLTQEGVWSIGNCNAAGGCEGTTLLAYPPSSTVQAATTGVVSYNPLQEAVCIKALEAQPCHGEDLWFDIPACVGTFYCASGGDAGVHDGGTSDATAPDGGDDAGVSPCEQALAPGSNEPTLRSCTSNGDCDGLAPPGGPYCVAGYCVAYPCGDYTFGGVDGGCAPAFKSTGESCNLDLEPLQGPASATSGTCAPGLTCRGALADGGLGTCATPSSVGGSCVAGTGCAFGLACSCGTCVLPPAQGACLAGMCQAGVAYCDDHDTCQPVLPFEADCSTNALACAPYFMCINSTCQIPAP